MEISFSRLRRFDLLDSCWHWRGSAKCRHMKLPPHTPRQVLEALARKPDVRAYLARGWIVLGSAILFFVCAMAVSHYMFGMPIHDGKTGQYLSPTKVLAGFLLLGGGAAFFLFMGILLHRWKPGPTNDL